MNVYLDYNSSWIGKPPEKISSIETNKSVFINSLIPPAPDMINSDDLNIFFDSNEPDMMIDFLQKREILEHRTPNDFLESIKKMDLVLTRRPELSEFSNCKIFPYGTTWIKDPELYWEDKKNEISFTLTSKIFIGVDGYEMRHYLASKLNYYKEKSNLNIIGYNSSHCPTQYETLEKSLSSDYNGRSELMKYKFNIAIENQRLPNYFTEKLIDCFITKTIPIYFGCPNIEDYFNIDGMILFQDKLSLEKALSSIDQHTYEEMKEAIEENYEKCLKYTGFFGKRVYDEIEKFLNEKELLK